MIPGIAGTELGDGGWAMVFAVLVSTALVVPSALATPSETVHDSTTSLPIMLVPGSSV